ncbi:MAG TPA: alanine racemase [Bacilli bacterium]
MDSFFRPTWVEISLDALRANISAFRRILPAEMKMMAVVKADAYGHGLTEIAAEAADAGMDYIGVAFFDEALKLRRSGFTVPLLVLGYTPPEAVALALQHDITITIYSDDLLPALREVGKTAAAAGKSVKVHIKLDTGMGRIGQFEQSAAIAYIAQTLALPGVKVEGLFTHYACADERDKTYTYEQHRKFAGIVDHFAAQGVRFPLLHAGNSATGIELPALSWNMLRLGISMYGFYPSVTVDHNKIHLEPVMSFKTKPVMIKTLPPGSGVSYGATYVTKTSEKIATLPVGYGDGYTRLLTGRAEVLIRGRRAPLVGRICMDQCMVDISHLGDVSLQDEVVLFGKQGDNVISADELAQKLGTINYEILCMVSARVPRVYVRNGQVVKTVNHLLE